MKKVNVDALSKQKKDVIEYVYIANVVMATNWGIFTPINTTTQFKSFIGEQVSIFSIDHTKVSSQNLKYPLSNRILSNWWEGSLNESLDESFTIQTTSRIIVFQAYII